MATAKILLLEDRLLDAQMVRKALIAAGFADIDISTNEADFVHALKAGGYSAIVSDNSIPGAAPDYALKLAKQYLPDVPVVCISGAVNEQDGAMVLEQNAADYISKEQLWRLPFVLRRITENEVASSTVADCDKDTLLVLLNCMQTLCRAATPYEIMAAVKSAASRLVGADAATFSITGNELTCQFDEETYSPAELRILKMLGESASACMSRVCLLRDLEIKLAESSQRLQASNEELQAFTYSIAHDLKSPLHGVHTISQMMLGQENLDADECRTIFDAISSDALRMTEMISALLKLYTLSLSDTKNVPFDLSEAARQVAANLTTQAPQRKIKITVAPEMQALGDPSLLNNLLENLISNAWKYTFNVEDATIEIGQIIDEHTGTPTYFVRDNGVGFDMKYATKLFKPFQRLHSETDYQGTGIGLATVNRIVKRYNGQVWAESTKGEGSTFYFTLPHA